MSEPKAARATEAALAAIARDNHRLRAVTHLDPDQARARAQTIDAAVSPGPLHGLTFVVKDLIDVAGLPTSGGSRLYGAEPAKKDAPVVRILNAAGAVPIGKANMHELAIGSAHNPWFGQVVNPRNPNYGTGGTSSGSAAAVAAGLCDFAVGTDSGGSNRSPAAATGLFGFKPTNGLLPIEGVIPVAPTLDTVGLLARDASILAAAFTALTGRTPIEIPTLEGLVFARPVGLHGEVDSVVHDALEATVKYIAAHGGRFVEIPFTDAPRLTEAGRDILRYEFAQNHAARVAERPDHVSPEVMVFLEIATRLSVSQYQDSLGLVNEQRQTWHRDLQAVDALILPTAPGLAPRLADEHTRVGERWVPYGPAGAEFRMWANTIGLPAIAIPVRRAQGLPASIQLAARPHSDEVLLAICSVFGRGTKAA